MISEKSRVVLDKLIKDKIIPKNSIFEITNDLIDKTFETWNELYHPNYEKKLKSSAIRYGKKIAGLNLMKLNEERIIDTQVKKKKRITQNCGIIYIITNPAYPGYYKIGITSDLESRLKSYQTYDPLRRFKVEHYNFVVDKRKVETDLLKKYKLDISKGEWVTNKEIKKEITKL